MPDSTPLQTTDATVSTLAAISPSDNGDGFTVWEFRVVAVATSGARAAYVRTAAFKQAGGAVSLVGAVGTPITQEDTAGWDCTVDVSANTVRVRVTGAAATTIDWHLQSAGPILGLAPGAQHPAIPRGCGWSI